MPPRSSAKRISILPTTGESGTRSRGTWTWAPGSGSPAGITSATPIYSDHSPDDPTIHDFENAGDTPIRFTTAELLD